MRVVGTSLIHRPNSGRLISELLVSLGLLFLAMTACFAVLGSATRSSEGAAETERALSLARSGMERIIANPESVHEKHQTQGFGAGRAPGFEATYQRDIWMTPLSGELSGLHRIVVEVQWDEGGRRVRLERYVR